MKSKAFFSPVTLPLVMLLVQWHVTRKRGVSQEILRDDERLIMVHITSLCLCVVVPLSLLSLV